MANAGQQAVNTSPKFYRLNHLKQLLPVSGSSIWGWVKAGKFPKPIKLSENCTAWKASEVDAWIQDRITSNQKTEV
jgi:prophage regulatory protein